MKSSWLWLCLTCVAVNGEGDGDVRLSGGPESREGRLEVFYRGTWGTICDDGFGPEEAGVACWQLGFGRPGANYSTIGPDVNNPPILLDDLDCLGPEARLDQCRHRDWGHNDCKDEEHVALRCQPDPCRSEPCQHGGTCTALDDVNITCSCSSITKGRRCETYINFCQLKNGGCSHQCTDNGDGSYVCECPDEGLQLAADGHSCYAPTVQVDCGRTMEVAFPRRYWPGLQEQYLTLSDATCRATGNSTHLHLSAPLGGCGTTSLAVEDGFIFENTVVSRDVQVSGLVSRVRHISMTVRCHYSNQLSLTNWYIVNNGQIRFSDVAQGHYQLSMTLYHNGQQYVGGGASRPLEPGEDLSIKFSLLSNDTSLQVFARNCQATPTAEASGTTQFLFLHDGCGADPSLHNSHNTTQEMLQLQAFQFLSDNSTAMLIHCDVVVCNITDASSRCSQGCLTSGGSGTLNTAAGTQISITG